jgi:hypothetical protein
MGPKWVHPPLHGCYGSNFRAVHGSACSQAPGDLGRDEGVHDYTSHMVHRCMPTIGRGAAVSHVLARLLF